MRHTTQYQRGDRIGDQYLVFETFIGGMGEVYQCVDLSSLTPVALKTFQSRFKMDMGFLDSFRQEISIWVDLGKHPHIVQCHMMRVIENQPFILMEYVSNDKGYGNNLRGHLRQGSLDFRSSMQFAIEICHGLIHANQKHPGIVHRDLKPDNLLLTPSNRIKITDFGLAKVTQEANFELPEIVGDSLIRNRHLSNLGGTPPYMAPEQWLGERLDCRTDIYAIGCILYEMLSRHIPYLGSTSAEFKQYHLTSDIPQLDDKIVGSQEANKLIAKCMAKRPGERFATVEQLLSQLLETYENQFNILPAKLDVGEKLTSAELANIGLTHWNLEHYVQAIDYFSQAIEANPQNALAYTNLGGVLFDCKQFAEALDNHKKAIEIDPNLAIAYSNYATTCVSLERIDTAQEYFQKALELAPTDQHTLVQKGILECQRKQYENALSCFDRVIELDPTYAQAYLGRAQTYNDMGRTDAALTDYTRAAELNPAFYRFLNRVYINRALTHMELEQLDMALRDINYAITINPEESKAFVNRAKIYQGMKKNDLAIEDLKRALELESRFALPHIFLAELYLEGGELDQANSHIEEAEKIGDSEISGQIILLKASIVRQIERHASLADLNKKIANEPNNGQHYFNRSNVYEQLGDVQKRITDLKKAVELNPQFAEAHFQLSSIYSNQRDYEAAKPHSRKLRELGDDRAFLADFVEAMMTSRPEPKKRDDELLEITSKIELDPRNDSLYQIRAKIYEDVRRYQDALEDINQSITLKPFNSEYYYLRGEILESLQRKEEAFADYDHTVKLNPKNEGAYRKRGYLHFSNWRLMEAIQDFSRAIAINPNNANNFRARAHILRIGGKLEESIKDYSKSIELEPNEGHSYAQRAEVLMKLTRYREALKDYDRVIEFRSDPQAQDLIDRSIAYALLEDYDKALADLDHALVLEPQSSKALLYKGVTLFQIRRYQDALYYLEKAEPLASEKAADVIQEIHRQLNRPKWVQLITSINFPGSTKLIRVLKVIFYLAMPAAGIGITIITFLYALFTGNTNLISALIVGGMLIRVVVWLKKIISGK